MPLGSPNLPYNFGPYASPTVTVANDSIPSEPIFTEMAKSLIPLVGRTALTEIFPEETIEERLVVIEQSFEGVDTIFPMVEMGKPDVVLSDNDGTRIRRYYQPLYIRRSMFVAHGEINSRVKPGTVNERWSPAEQIQEKMARMVRQHNLTWDIYRAMMLLGGINYTDPRTGVGAQVSAQIPAHNLFAYNVASGYRGRKEASLFRTIVDSNVADPGAAAGIPWTHPDSAIVEGVQRFARWFKDTNKSDITAMYMSPELRDIIVMNNEIKLALGGLIPKFNAVAGDMTTSPTNNGLIIPAGGIPNVAGRIGIGPKGDLLSIAGIPVRVVDTMYKDPVDGVVKRIWPKNKVVFVSGVDSQGVAEAAGRTQFCVSEESGGQPGVWTRIQTQTQVPAAPGMYVQMGNAGLPYIKYPYRIAHMTVASLDDINNRLGVIGDLSFGTF